MSATADHFEESPPDPWSSVRTWPRWARRALAGLVALTLLTVAAGLGAVWTVRRPLPQTDGSVRLAGLDAEVEVWRDDYGIPQIYADSARDLFMAQGYVHAQDRFFQMDYRRRLAAGRLSEWVGEAGLETDKMVRTLGWRRVAEQELALLSPETVEALEAYSAGVNAWLAGRSLSQISLEYTLLGLTGEGIQPEKWTPVDSLSWLKSAAWDMRGSNLDAEIERAILSVTHTAAEVAELYPTYPYDRHRPIVEGGAVVDGVFEAAAEEPTSRQPPRAPLRPDMVRALERVRRTLDRTATSLGRGDGIGSNGWVVDGRRSATGAPILANDPHLSAEAPGAWTQVGLRCRTVDADCAYDVSGFSFAGVPGVVIGHNADIAWGLTKLGGDTADLFLERVEGQAALYDGRLEPLGLRDETIRVADAEENFRFTVRTSRHGPLLSDVSTQLSTVGANAVVPTDSPPRDTGYAVAVAWTALRPGRSMDALLAIDRARNWSDLRAAAELLDSPAQNILYADKDGNIGYQAAGRFPVRGPGNDGGVPAPGWLPEADWKPETVPFKALPSVLNPEQGWVTAANQAVTDEDYPYFLGADWDTGYRSERINSMVESAITAGDLDVDATAAMQLDRRDPLAATLTPYLLDILQTAPYYAGGQRMLVRWDGVNRPGSPGAAYFQAVVRQVLRLTFADEMRPSIAPRGGARWTAVLTDLLDEPDSHWWDDVTTPEIESRDDILRLAEQAATDDLVRHQNRNPAKWTWGHHHRLVLRHPLAPRGAWLARQLLVREGWEVGGSETSVDATAYDARGDFTVTTAPSMRMVVSLADFEQSRWISMTGASGHAFSAHYADQTDLWARGESLPWRFSREAVEEAVEDRLTLRP